MSPSRYLWLLLRLVGFAGALWYTSLLARAEWHMQGSFGAASQQIALDEGLAAMRTYPFISGYRLRPMRIGLEFTDTFNLPPQAMTQIILATLPYDGRNVWLWFNLARAQERMGHRKGRRMALEEAHAVAPPNPTINRYLELVKEDDAKHPE
jgi:hypothetical protein